MTSHLAAQLDAARRGARAAHDALRGASDPDHARAEIDEIEHDGDAHRALLVAALTRTVTSPIDREDIYRFSRSIDDVLDNTRDFVREWHLYGCPTEPGLAELLLLADTVLGHLEAAVAMLDGRAAQIAAGALEARKAGNQIRYRFQEELASLFERGIDADTLRLRELYRRLDVVGLRLGEAADVLADASVKRTLL